MIAAWRKLKIEILLKPGKMQRYSRPVQKTYCKQPRNHASEQGSNEPLFVYKPNTSVNISEDCKRFLNKVSITELDYEDARICKGDLNEVKLLKNLKLNRKH